jgi:hypothetical protein
LFGCGEDNELLIVNRAKNSDAVKEKQKRRA